MSRLLVALLLAGCAALPPVPAAPRSASKQAGPPGTCSATLVVHSVQVRPGCRIDERVTQAPGRLVYPCSGGPATATFGLSRFVGEVSPRGDVDLLIQTGFDFTDRCHWTTKQRILGRIGEPAWSYEYREEPDPGQSGCARGCTATASVRVSVP